MASGSGLRCLVGEVVMKKKEGREVGATAFGLEK